MNNIQNIGWKHCLIDVEASIKDVISNLELTGLQIVVLVSAKNELKGVITDGDIRRSILNGYDLNSSAKKIMIKTPIIVDEDISINNALSLMKLNSIRHLPIVDSKNIITGIHMLDSINTSLDLDNALLIMAGGFGKRLAPYTDNCPKPMLKVNGKPMLQHIIEKAIAEGFSNFIISVFYLSEQIKEFFGDGSKWNISIQYIKEDNPLGTAGALSIIDPLPELPFVITNGDVMTNIKYSDILKFHNDKEAHATMAVRSHEWQHPFGVVITDGIEIKHFEEKPKYVTNVNAGVYVLNPDTLKFLEKNEYCDMPTLFTRIGAKNKTIVYPAHESWADIGNQKDLDLINKYT